MFQLHRHSLRALAGAALLLLAACERDREWADKPPIEPPTTTQNKPADTGLPTLDVTCGDGAPCPLAAYMEEQNVCTLVVMQGDRVAVYHERRATEACAHRIDRGRHGIASMTKSITSLMLGQLLQDHPVLTLKTPLADALRPVGVAFPGRGQTLRDALQMSTGMIFHDRETEQVLRIHKDAGPDEPRNFAQSVNTYLKTAKFRSAGADGRFAYHYSNFDTTLLGLVLQGHLTAPDNLRTAFQRSIWSEIGPQNRARWKGDFDGNPSPYCCAEFSAIDVARLGRWVLDRYRDPAQPLHEWVRTSVADRVETPTVCDGVPVSYGYQWWVPGRGDSFTALGRGGQFLHLFPAQDLTVVQLGVNARSGEDAMVCAALATHRALATAMAE